MENQEQQQEQQQEPHIQEGLAALCQRVNDLEKQVVEKLVAFEKKVEESLQNAASQQRESMKKSLQSVSEMLNDIMSSLGIIVTKNPNAGMVSYQVPYKNPQAVGALVTLTRDVEKMKNGPGIVGPNGQHVFTGGGNNSGKQ